MLTLVLIHYTNIYLYVYICIPCSLNLPGNKLSVYKTQSQLFSHHQQKGELGMLENEIIKMIPSFWNHRNVLEVPLDPLDGTELSGSQDVYSRTLVGRSLWRTRRTFMAIPEGPHGWCSLKTAQCWEKLSAALMSEEMLHVSGYMGLPEQESSLRTVWPLFMDMTWGRWRDERRVHACSARVGN